jgi:hypothetical protein
MSMLGIALLSLRSRSGSFAASFLTLLLGATIVMTFASMLDTSTGSGVDPATEETLITMASVVGAWGTIIVAFAVASTLTQAARQRGAELALLKSIGATPAQLRRMIAGEAAAMAIAAVALAIAPAMLTGRLLLELLEDSGQVADGVSYGFGGFALTIGLGTSLVAATIAALVAARRTTRATATEALVAASTGDTRIGWKRALAGAVFLVSGLSNAVVTATVFHGKGVDAMQTGGQASILVAIGLALLAPVLVGRLTRRIAAPLERRSGVSGYLMSQNVRRRGAELATTLMPIILFTGIATGTLYMQSIENGAGPAPGATITAAEAKDVETLNFVVVGMIALFAAVMLINTLLAATIARRREFGQSRLAGLTRDEVLRMVALESVTLVSTGVVLGTIASLFTIVPYSIARTSSVVPESTPLIYIGIVIAAAALTLAATVGAARRVTEAPAVEAVAVAG